MATVEARQFLESGDSGAEEYYRGLGLAPVPTEQQATEYPIVQTNGKKFVELNAGMSEDQLDGAISYAGAVGVAIRVIRTPEDHLH